MMQSALPALTAELQQRRHRGLLWVHADRPEGERLLDELFRQLDLAPEAGVLLGERPLAGLDPLPGRRAGAVLGRTLQWALYDAYAGFNPNHFAQLAGTVAAGGWLMLLSPPAQQWSDYPDPEYRRLCVEPWTSDSLEPRFLQRLVRDLLADTGVTRLTPNGLTPPRWSLPAVAAPPPVGPCQSLDQQQAVRRILSLLDERRTALVITADRGRGKSSAIGLALARRAQEKPLQVVLTAPSWQATESLRARLQEADPSLCWQQGQCQLGQLSLRWMTPARLAAECPPADLLVIDEAAAIATPLLAAFARRYRRLVFATTQHGYEGNGRGFALRFRAELARLVPRLEELELKTPIRWAPHDPLECTLNRLLLLDAEPRPQTDGDSSSALQIDTLERSVLLADEALLRELFGLLILAHYRTTPGDLRVLLDSPNLQLQQLRLNGRLVGCVLIAREGELSDELAEGVWQGVRRPTGHLLPQALIAHEGYEEVAAWRAWRIMRIVVHPACQQQGLGSQLLAAVVAQAQAAGVDYLGASFAAGRALLGYWRRNGFLPLRVGDQLDPITGSHAVLVLRPLSARTRAWCARARQRYGERLRYRLGGSLCQLPAGLLPELFAQLEAATPNADQIRRLRGFAHQSRSLESTLTELDQLLLTTVAHWSDWGLNESDQQLLVARIWRQQPAAEVAAPSGARAQLQRLRELAGQLLARITPTP